MVSWRTSVSPEVGWLSCWLAGFGLNAQRHTESFFSFGTLFSVLLTFLPAVFYTVIRHDCAPFFTLTSKLEPHKLGTLLHWEEKFDDPKVLEAIKPIAVPATEQNIDRLIQALEKTSAVEPNVLPVGQFPNAPWIPSQFDFPNPV